MPAAVWGETISTYLLFQSRAGGAWFMSAESLPRSSLSLSPEGSKLCAAPPFRAFKTRGGAPLKELIDSLTTQKHCVLQIKKTEVRFEEKNDVKKWRSFLGPRAGHMHMRMSLAAFNILSSRWHYTALFTVLRLINAKWIFSGIIFQTERRVCVFVWVGGWHAALIKRMQIAESLCLCVGVCARDQHCSWWKRTVHI